MLRKRASKAKSSAHEERADRLWFQVRSEAVSPVSDSIDRDSTGYDSEMAELHELSTALRAAYVEEDSSLTEHAQRSFAPIHNRLMDAISETPVKSLKDKYLKPRFALPMPFSVIRKPGLNWALGAAVLVLVAGGGHQIGRMRAHGEDRILPVQSLVDDFDAGLRSPSPFEFVALQPDANQKAAQWLSRSVGAPVHLPSTQGAGIQFLGARRHILWQRPVAQTHYLKHGVHIALYQVREPGCGLPDMDEVNVRGRLFLTTARNNYRVVAWRSGDVVMTLVSPLEMGESLELAANLRAHPEPVV